MSNLNEAWRRYMLSPFDDAATSALINALRRGCHPHGGACGDGRAAMEASPSCARPPAPRSGVWWYSKEGRCRRSPEHRMATLITMGGFCSPNPRAKCYLSRIAMVFAEANVAMSQQQTVFEDLWAAAAEAASAFVALQKAFGRLR